MDLLRLKDSAVKAAYAAGGIIRKHMNKEVAVERKPGLKSHAAQVVTAIDRACEDIILSYLLPTCETYDLALLSEETTDDGSRFEKDFFWCIDPLDGTLAFINKHPGFSVSIALVKKNGDPIVGVVYDPIKGNMYYAIKGGGVFKNEEPWVIENVNKQLTYVTDRKLKDTPRSSEIDQFMKNKVAEMGLDGVDEISGSGSVLNGIHVLENGPAFMLKFPKEEQGGGSIWDFAATACIFEELGLPATNYEGKKLDLNKKEGAFMNMEGVFYSNF